MSLISLKLYYSKAFKQEHLDQYGERHCDDLTDQIKVSISEYFKSKKIVTLSQYLLPSDAECGCVPHIRLEITLKNHTPVKPLIDYIIKSTEQKIDKIKIG